MAIRPEVLAFLNDCKENPDDDTPRLVLADWLEEHGDERGKFVRMQCLRAAAEGDNALFRAPLPAEEAELLEKYRQDWMGVLAEKGIRTELRRGLVEANGGSRKLLSKRLAKMKEQECLAWVDSLCVYGFKVDELSKLATSPQWKRLTKLDLGAISYYADHFITPGRVGVGRGDWSALASVEAMPGLTELDLSCQDIGTEGATVLANLPDLKRLRVLELSRNNLGDKGAEALTTSRSLTGLRRLDLSQNRMRAEGFAVLAQWEGLAAVMYLSLLENYPGAEGMAALAASPWLRSLATLRLGCPDHCLPESFGSRCFGPQGAAALAEAQNLKNLKHLYLKGHQIGPEGIEALANSKAFPSLVELDLSANGLGDAGAIALANSPLLKQLHRLDLRFNAIGDRGAEALANSPNASNLTSLGYLANWETSDQGLVLLKERFGEVVNVGNRFTSSPE